MGSTMEKTTNEIPGETTGGQEILCEDNEEIVGSVVSGRDDIPETEPFDITGPDFRVIVSATSTSTPPASGAVGVDVLREGGDFEGGARAFVTEFDSTGTDSSVALDGPGTFRLKIDADDASYEVAVCQTPGGGEGTNGNTDDNDGDGDDNDDGVIDDTIPDKDLPGTGGSPAFVVGGAALLFLYGVLVAWRLMARER